MTQCGRSSQGLQGGNLWVARSAISRTRLELVRLKYTQPRGCTPLAAMRRQDLGTRWRVSECRSELGVGVDAAMTPSMLRPRPATLGGQSRAREGSQETRGSSHPSYLGVSGTGNPSKSEADRAARATPRGNPSSSAAQLRGHEDAFIHRWVVYS